MQRYAEKLMRVGIGKNSAALEFQALLELLPGFECTDTPLGCRPASQRSGVRKISLKASFRLN